MAVATRMNRATYELFRWRYELSVPRKLALAVGIAALTGLLAQVRFMLPWTPVPVTGQTFAVLLAAVFLGRWWGGVSMAIYGGLGWAGVPWFTGWTSGLTGTAGYVVGFVLAALFLGHFVDKYVRARSFVSLAVLMAAADFVFVYVPGLAWLSIWLRNAGHPAASLAAVVGMGFVPFIIGDCLKIAAAAAIARAATPKLAFNTEKDQDKWKTWRLP